MNQAKLSTIIIGAGAAGLAAGRLLHDAGILILILEARDRIGGRICTDHQFANFPIELGAEFIHGDGAVTHKLVTQAGLTCIPVTRMGNLWWASQGQQARPLAQLPMSLRDTITQLLGVTQRLSLTNLPLDLSLADYLRSEGWSGEAIEIADVLLAQTCCAPVETLSCEDLRREIHVDKAGTGEVRIHEGYASLLAWYSLDLPLCLKRAVSEIRWDKQGVTITAGSDVFRAQTCILTVPISLLQQNTIHFEPPLSPEHTSAIRAFRMEPATKLIYRFREPLWSNELTYMAHEGLTARWWTPGYQRSGDPVLIAYITATRARQLDSLPEAKALALGLDELSNLLGLDRQSVRRLCVAARRVSWAHDPHTRGGYAHIPPHTAQARVTLARSQGGVLFFAGEATAYETNPQTVHGAIESGWRAARECLSVL